MRWQFSGITVDTASRSIQRDGAAQPVEPQVFDLVALLAGRPGEVVTRDELIEAVWGGRIVSDAAISARIAAARRVLGDDGKRQAIIRTVTRRGLMLVPDVVTEEARPRGGRHGVQRIRYTRGPRGHSLAYSITGEGPPVLFFPPPLTSDLEHEWRMAHDWSCIGPISERFSYLRFDHAGSGQSDRHGASFEPAEWAADALAVVDAAGFERVAGLSMSGGVYTAVHFAALYPERLGRLVIAGGYVDGRTRRTDRTDAPLSDPLRSMVSQEWGTQDNPFAMALGAAYFPEGPLEFVQEMAASMQAALSAADMITVRDAINSGTLAPLLDRVRCPTLVLHGSRDGVHPIAQARKLAAGIPGAELVPFDTANHIPLPGQPEWPRFTRTLVEFLGRA